MCIPHMWHSWRLCLLWPACSDTSSSLFYFRITFPTLLPFLLLCSVLFYFLIFIYLFFSFIFISWRLITLQYCSGFCYTLTWISHGFTYVPHPDAPSRLLPHPIPQNRSQAQVGCMRQVLRVGALGRLSSVLKIFHCHFPLSAAGSKFELNLWWGNAPICFITPVWNLSPPSIS